jgi:hypothetical protein
MATLKFEVKGELGSITLRGFLDTVENAFKILLEYDKAISGEPKGSTDWVITNVSAGSLCLETEPISRIPNKNYGPKVANSFIRGWSEIRKGVTPAYLSSQGMRKAKQLAKIVGSEGMRGLLISGLIEQAEITPDVSKFIGQLLKVKHRSIGSVEGELKTISIQGGSRFVIYHSRTGKAINCNIPIEKLASMIKTEMLGRKVIASGKIHSNIKGEPLEVDAESIRIIRRKEELPSIESISGSDPYFTGGLTTEEFIRGIRGD